MARNFRQWSSVRSDVRNLIREATAAASYWSDTELLLYANLAQDLRAAQSIESGENWFLDRITTPVVANQREYLQIEGRDRIRTISLQRTDGSVTQEYRLVRDERWDDGVVSGGGQVGVGGALPTARLTGRLIILDPPPTQSEGNVVVEYSSLPDRLTGDSSTFDKRFPSLVETVLTFDIWAMAMGVEDAQGNADPQGMSKLDIFHRKIERQWDELIDTQYQGPTYASRYSLGD